MAKTKLVASIIIPAYNQKAMLKPCIQGVANSLSKAGMKPFEIIICEDGSTDGTYQEAERLARIYKFVRISHAEKKAGRGSAVMRGFVAAKSDVVAYIDADQATDTSHLPSLIRSAIENGIATGSRYLKSSKAERSPTRLFFSMGVNFLDRLFLGSKVSDHQCGFKAFKREIALKLGQHAVNKHWFWDTEMLVLAQKYGYAVGEIPVVWKEQDSTTVSLFKDTVDMGSNILRMWYSLNFGRWND